MAKNTLIIAAGGVGKRTGLDIPKQFYMLSGIPVIVRTIRVFENMDDITDIIITCHKDYVEYTKTMMKEYGIDKVKCVTEGGDTRRQSVYNALKNVSDDTDYVLIHDAARPFINEDSIRRCILDAESTGCAAVGKRVVDTLKRTDGAGFITDTVDRDNLWQIQTPQIFKKDIICDCHQRCINDCFEATDDCMICERYGYSIKITESSCNNIKITDKSDIQLAEAIFNV